VTAVSLQHPESVADRVAKFKETVRSASQQAASSSDGPYWKSDDVFTASGKETERKERSNSPESADNG
jgi:hypothetical protein